MRLPMAALPLPPARMSLRPRGIATYTETQKEEETEGEDESDGEWQCQEAPVRPGDAARVADLWPDVVEVWWPLMERWLDSAAIGRGSMPTLSLKQRGAYKQTFMLLAAACRAVGSSEDEVMHSAAMANSDSLRLLMASLLQSEVRPKPKPKPKPKPNVLQHWSATTAREHLQRTRAMLQLHCSACGLDCEGAIAVIRAAEGKLRPLLKAKRCMVDVASLTHSPTHPWWSGRRSSTRSSGHS